MVHLQRLITLVLGLSLMIVGSGTSAAQTRLGPWVETRFQTGCQPGPFEPPPWPEHLESHYPPLSSTPVMATLNVNLAR